MFEPSISGSPIFHVEPAELPEMISDGKRMRMVWRPGDGDGDSSDHLVERNMFLIRGHPTWKIYVGELMLPIIRGSSEEPPHYVYLDDRACYAIWCSKAYNNEELRKFWPWDFNHQGHIRQGRFNRGQAAYLDDSFTEIAKGELRSKGQWYTFSGAPEVSQYKPRRPKKSANLVEQESDKPLESEHTDLIAQEEESPIAMGGGRKLYFSPKLKSSAMSAVGREELYSSKPLKRLPIAPTEIKSAPKRVKTFSPTQRPITTFGGDGASDSDAEEHNSYTDEEHGMSAPSPMDEIRAKLADLAEKKKCTEQHLASVTKERDIYRELIIMLLSSKIAQKNALDNRITAFQNIVQTLSTLKFQCTDITNTAIEEIKPTKALAEDYGTILDGPGKAMYEWGMDEDWSDIHKEAMRRADEGLELR